MTQNNDGQEACHLLSLYLCRPCLHRLPTGMTAKVQRVMNFARAGAWRTAYQLEQEQKFVLTLTVALFQPYRLSVC
jgi:hypothetical protein